MPMVTIVERWDSKEMEPRQLLHRILFPLRFLALRVYRLTSRALSLNTPEKPRMDLAFQLISAILMFILLTLGFLMSKHLGVQLALFLGSLLSLGWIILIILSM